MPEYGSLRLCVASAVNFLVSSGVASTGVAVVMEKFPLSPALEIAEREAEVLLLRCSGSLHPGIGVKQATAIVATHLPKKHLPRRCGGIFYCLLG